MDRDKGRVKDALNRQVAALLIKYNGCWLEISSEPSLSPNGEKKIILMMLQTWTQHQALLSKLPFYSVCFASFSGYIQIFIIITSILLFQYVNIQIVYD